MKDTGRNDKVKNILWGIRYFLPNGMLAVYPQKEVGISVSFTQTWSSAAAFMLWYMQARNILYQIVWGMKVWLSFIPQSVGVSMSYHMQNRVKLYIISKYFVVLLKVSSERRREKGQIFIITYCLLWVYVAGHIVIKCL